MGFLGNPISASFLFLAAASIAWHLFSSIRSRTARTATLLRS
jgi:putative tricarboxylic transport membrane protein